MQIFWTQFTPIIRFYPQGEDKERKSNTATGKKRKMVVLRQIWAKQRVAKGQKVK